MADFAKLVEFRQPQLNLRQRCRRTSLFKMSSGPVEASLGERPAAGDAEQFGKVQEVCADGEVVSQLAVDAAGPSEKPDSDRQIAAQSGENPKISAVSGDARSTSRGGFLVQRTQQECLGKLVLATMNRVQGAPAEVFR